MQFMENTLIFFSLLMVTFLIIIGRVPAIMRFRGIFFRTGKVFFDENDIFDRFRSWRIFRVGERIETNIVLVVVSI